MSEHKDLLWNGKTKVSFPIDSMETQTVRLSAQALAAGFVELDNILIDWRLSSERLKKYKLHLKDSLVVAVNE